MDCFLIKHSAKSKAPEEPTLPKTGYDKKYDQGKRKRVFQSSWLTEFRWLRVDDAGTATCKIYRKFPFIADQKSAFYTGTEVTRKDSLSCHEKSTKHTNCVLKQERGVLKKTIFYTFVRTTRDLVRTGEFSKLLVLGQVHFLEISPPLPSMNLCQDFTT